MSGFRGCLVRNTCIGLLTASCAYIYCQFLVEIGSDYAISLAATFCGCSFLWGFALYSNDQDHSLFKYLLACVRPVIFVVSCAAFLGLLCFSWMGLQAGLIASAYLCGPFLSYFGPSKPIEPNSPSLQHSYDLWEYIGKTMHIPACCIVPLSCLGLFLFQWWGLGAGFIGGSLIGYTAHVLWGPEKPVMPMMPISHERKFAPIPPPEIIAITSNTSTISGPPIIFSGQKPSDTDNQDEIRHSLGIVDFY